MSWWKIAVRKVALFFAKGLGHFFTYIDDSLVKNISRAPNEFASITIGTLKNWRYGDQR